MKTIKYLSFSGAPPFLLPVNCWNGATHRQTTKEHCGQEFTTYMSRNYTLLCNYSHRQKREPVLLYMVFKLSLFIPVLAIIIFDLGYLSTPSFKHKCCCVFFLSIFFKLLLLFFSYICGFCMWDFHLVFAAIGNNLLFCWIELLSCGHGLSFRCIRHSIQVASNQISTSPLKYFNSQVV